MAYAKGHKERTRIRILEKARELFVRQGFEDTSIEQIMAASDLTRGAFYAHFESKRQLYALAMEEANSEVDYDREGDWGEKLLKDLADLERVSAENSLYVRTLFAANRNSKDPVVRAAQTKVFKRTLNELVVAATAGDEPSEAEVLRLAAMMVGAEVIARNIDDPVLTQEVATACLDKAKAVLQGSTENLAPFHRPPVYLWDSTTIN